MQKFHPSPIRHILFAACGLIFASLLAFALQSAIPSAPAYMLFFTAAGLAILYSAAAFLRSQMTTYSLENNSLKMERKLLSLESQVIPIKNIDNLRIKISVFGRLLSIADVYVDTPGSDGFEMVLTDIPQQAAEALADEVEKLKKGE